MGDAQGIEKEILEGKADLLWELMPEEEKSANPRLTKEGVRLIVKKLLAPSLKKVQAHPKAEREIQANPNGEHEGQGIVSWSAPLSNGQLASFPITINVREGRRTLLLTQLVTAAIMVDVIGSGQYKGSKNDVKVAFGRGLYRERLLLVQAGYEKTVHANEAEWNYISHTLASRFAKMDERSPGWRTRLGPLASHIELP